MIENNLAAYDDLFLGLKAKFTGQLIDQDEALVHGIYIPGSTTWRTLGGHRRERDTQQASKIAKVIVAAIIDDNLS